MITTSEQTNELDAAIANAIGLVGSVPKRGVNPHHRYHYATEADILHALAPALSASGLSLGISWRLAEERESRKGVLAVEVHIRLGHASGQWLQSTAIGWSSNPGDKAVAGAVTTAYKYWLAKTFAIALGDDPDGDHSGGGRQGRREEPQQRRQQRSQPQRQGPPPREHRKQPPPDDVESKQRQAYRDAIRWLSHDLDIPVEEAKARMRTAWESCVGSPDRIGAAKELVRMAVLGPEEPENAADQMAGPEVMRRTMAIG